MALTICKYSLRGDSPSVDVEEVPHDGDLLASDIQGAMERLYDDVLAFVMGEAPDTSVEPRNP